MSAYLKITDDPEEGAQYLKKHKAKELDTTESDTFKRTTYEIPDDDSVKVLIEHESKLEAPEYYYHLLEFVGEE